MRDFIRKWSDAIRSMPMQRQLDRNETAMTTPREMLEAVALPELPQAAVYDPGRFGVCYSAEQMHAYARAYGAAIAASLDGQAEDAERYRAIRDSQACSLSISHNDHHNMYMSVSDTMDEDSQGYYRDVSDDERQKMIETDSIWTLHVYPNTPVGFNVYHAATLDAVIDAARSTKSEDETS